MADQYVVLGLAHTRSRWFGEVARWSTTGAAPLEFVKCMKPDEVRAIVGSGRRVSALLVDGSLTHFDRDLVAAVSEAGAVTIVVDERASGNDWDATGCAAVLDAGFDRAALIEVLSRFAAGGRPERPSCHQRDGLGRSRNRTADRGDGEPVEREPRRSRSRWHRGSRHPMTRWGPSVGAWRWPTGPDAPISPCTTMSVM